MYNYQSVDWTLSTTMEKAIPQQGYLTQNIDVTNQIVLVSKEEFLLGDSGKNDSERILLFGRERHIEWSGEMKLH
uniref:LPS export ABC transporter periplasmic protein LptC n=1 Tax=Ditylenchus dipsaci TaxID=166011 RepID=A0A915E655_9BILA